MPERNETNIIKLYIAVIVIITLLLAGFLYYFTLPPPVIERNSIDGSLTFNPESTPYIENATFTLTLDSPVNPKLADIEIRLYLGSNLTFNFTYIWTHISSDINHVSTGDILTISMPNVDIRGYTLVLRVEGYIGVLSCKIPQR